MLVCTICHHSYCFDVNMKKRNDVNIFGAIDTQKKDKDDKRIFKYGILSCYHHEHQNSYIVDEDMNADE